MQATGLVVGSVIDIYRGAGQHDLLKVLLEQDFVTAYAERKKMDEDIDDESNEDETKEITRGDDGGDAEKNDRKDQTIETFVFVREPFTFYR